MRGRGRPFGKLRAGSRDSRRDAGATSLGSDLFWQTKLMFHVEHGVENDRKKENIFMAVSKREARVRKSVDRIYHVP
jgi:hypothetical protein